MPLDEEAASEGAAEALETLAGELELDDAQVVEPRTVRYRRRTWRNRSTTPDCRTELEAQHCRYPVSSESGVRTNRCHADHLFCGLTDASGSLLLPRSPRINARRAEERARAQSRKPSPAKLSRLAIVAALKRE